jgi:CRP/FNR family transcriptional regulator, polysaccharide utilization system transcription regulator
MINFYKKVNCENCQWKCIVSYIPNEIINLLDENKTIVNYSPGQLIVKQSSFASRIIYLTSGFVKVLKEGNKGKNSFIKVISEGNFISVPIHENQKKYSFTAIALTEVSICEIQESIIHNSLSKNPKFFDYLNDQFYIDQQFLMNKLLILASRNSHGKLASAIIYLNNFNNPDFSIFDFITRKDLADFASISLESVNKIIQELSNDKIIFIDRKGLKINKLILLEKLSDLG